MFKLLMLILFIWLFIAAVRLIFKVTWGAAKAMATILFVVALPVFFGCLLAAGSMILLIPVALIGISVSVLKACV